MSANFDYAAKYSGELDKMIVQEAKTGFLADNAFKAKFVGSKTVYLPEISFNGLGNYTRTTNGEGSDVGYASGETTLKYREYSLTKERSKQLILDAQDADESGVPDLAGKMVGEFTRTQVNPEIDAYNISKLYKTANDNSHTSVFSADTATTNLLSVINSVEASTGYGNEQIVALVDPVMYAALMTSSDLQRSITVSEFKQGDVNLKLRYLNGCAIIPISSERMHSAFDFHDGTTEFGFEPADGAVTVRAIVMPKGAASLVKKVDKVKMFTPDEVEDMDAYKINFRLYYDLIVKNSQKGTIFAIKT